MEKFVFSKLNKTWVLDLDGTVVVHNGYLKDGEKLLDGVKEFFGKIDEKDKVVFLTSRDSKYKEITENFLKENNIRYDYIIYDLPHGERILVNDNKPSGLKMSHSVNKNRDEELTIDYVIDETL